MPSSEIPQISPFNKKSLISDPKLWEDPFLIFISESTPQWSLALRSHITDHQLWKNLSLNIQFGSTQLSPQVEKNPSLLLNYDSTDLSPLTKRAPIFDPKFWEHPIMNICKTTHCWPSAPKVPNSVLQLQEHPSLTLSSEPHLQRKQITIRGNVKFSINKHAWL